SGDRSPADPHWSDQHGIAPNLHIVLNMRLMLALTVIVASNRAGSDVDVVSKCSVAQVGKVLRLGATADAGFLDLHKVADDGAFSDISLHPQPGKRAHSRAVPYAGFFDHARIVYDHAVPDRHIPQPGP